MNEVIIYERLIDVLDRCGLIIRADAQGKIEELVDMQRIDSLLYIASLVELENEFNIDIPDEYLGENIFSSLDGLKALVLELAS